MTGAEVNYNHVNDNWRQRLVKEQGAAKVQLSGLFTGGLQQDTAGHSHRTGAEAHAVWTSRLTWCAGVP